MKKINFKIQRQGIKSDDLYNIASFFHGVGGICTDGNDKILKAQEIPYTDFKTKEATVWCVKGIVLLPSEY